MLIFQVIAIIICILETCQGVNELDNKENITFVDCANFTEVKPNGFCLDILNGDFVVKDASDINERDANIKLYFELLGFLAARESYNLKEDIPWIIKKLESENMTCFDSSPLIMTWINELPDIQLAELITCFEELKWLLCTFYFPLCVSGNHSMIYHRVPACRSECEKATSSDECSSTGRFLESFIELNHICKYSFPHQDGFNCSKFPTTNCQIRHAGERNVGEVEPPNKSNELTYITVAVVIFAVVVVFILIVGAFKRVKKRKKPSTITPHYTTRDCDVSIKEVANI